MPPIPSRLKKKVETKPSFGSVRRIKEYRCGRCGAVHRYLAEKCQQCRYKSLEEIPEDECTACEGAGKSSKGFTCVPCKGTGRRQPKDGAGL